jgi:hypothetical protein
MAHQGYGFCEFLTEEDAEYACKIMNQIKLWGKPIRVNKVCLGSKPRRSSHAQTPLGLIPTYLILICRPLLTWPLLIVSCLYSPGVF